MVENNMKKDRDETPILNSKALYLGVEILHLL